MKDIFFIMFFYGGHNPSLKDRPVFAECNGKKRRHTRGYAFLL